MKLSDGMAALMVWSTGPGYCGISCWPSLFPRRWALSWTSNTRAPGIFQSRGASGFRFFVALSSVAAIQGNRGQTNYAAANRMMSALLSQIKASHPAILCKALSLPPISGGGMADDPDLRLLLEKMGVGYLELAELKELFCQELFMAGPQEVGVMFMSRLPKIKYIRLDTDDPEPVAPNH